MASVKTGFWGLLLGVGLLGGCSVDQFARWADRSAYTALDKGQQEALGKASDFHVAYRPLAAAADDPAGAIRIGDKTLTIGRGKPVTLSLNECLEVAFRNSRSFQDRKETLYSSALALANSRRSWDVPLVGGDAAGDLDLDKTMKGLKSTTGAANVGPGLTQRFVHGGLLSLGYALSLATDLTGGPGTTLGSLMEANFTQPLLRGGWRGFAYEGQYRLERDFLFEVFAYERFTQTFAVDITTAYYNVLLLRDTWENERANIERLQQTFALTRVLVKGGQVSQIQQDQAEQDLLNAQVRLQRNEQEYRDALDNFKLQLGLPIGADLSLDYPGALKALNKVGPAKLGIGESDAVVAALSARPDLLTRRAQLRDRIRDVELAADAFYPQLDLAVGISAASSGGGPRDFWATRLDRHNRYARLMFQYDIDQTDNRDAYRLALLAENRARRGLEEFEDRVRLEVRESYRSLLRSRRSYELQKKSVAIAVRRRKLAALQQREGLASARDVLEAEEALRGAQNGLTASLINYTNTRLRFLAQLGMLQVDEKGRIDERSTPRGFDRVRRLYDYVAPPVTPAGAGDGAGVPQR